jgi:hypothetical protein
MQEDVSDIFISLKKTPDEKNSVIYFLLANFL